MKKVIALLTDFGNSDSYVGVMKGVMMSIYPDISFIDISHSINPFNILSASYLLYSAWDYFPPGTVFLSVVDPGVGTNRNTLIYINNDKILITPDNGTVSLLKRMHTHNHIYFVDSESIEKIRIGTSTTFHGRDIFAPLAAHITKTGLHSIRVLESDPVILNRVCPMFDKHNNLITGNFMHIDHFGNCISTIHSTDLPEIPIEASVLISIEKTIIKEIKRCFSDVLPGELLVYWGSSGFLEVAVREGNAAKRLHITPQMEIHIEYFS